ncbi:MAG: hypothetical protein ACOC3V_03025, partial [bacterium]
MKILYMPSPGKVPVFENLLSYLENEIDGFNSQELDSHLNNLTNTPDTYLLLTTGIDYACLETALKIIYIIKEIFKDVKLNIVLGGPWTSGIDLEQFQQAFSEVKYICVGEGEGFLKTL